MDQRIINLYDEYTHKPLSRQEFLRRLAMLTGSTATALAILPMIEVNQAHAAVTSADDLFTERIKYAGVNGDMEAYVARPNKPRHEIKIVSPANNAANVPVRCSSLNLTA